MRRKFAVESALGAPLWTKIALRMCDGTHPPAVRPVRNARAAGPWSRGNPKAGTGDSGLNRLAHPVQEHHGDFALRRCLDGLSPAMLRAHAASLAVSETGQRR